MILMRGTDRHYSRTSPQANETAGPRLIRARRQPRGRLPRRGPAVGDAVGDISSSEATAGGEEAWMLGDPALDRGHPRQVAELVLRGGSIAPVDARQHRLARDSQQRTKRRPRQRYEFRVGSVERLR